MTLVDLLLDTERSFKDTANVTLVPTCSVRDVLLVVADDFIVVKGLAEELYVGQQGFGGNAVSVLSNSAWWFWEGKARSSRGNVERRG
jgi:hypothetical protein